MYHLANITPFIKFAASTCQGSTFFGLVPWYKYLPDSDFAPGQCSNIVKFNPLGANSDLLLVGLAVLDDLVRIAGLVAVGFVIYGGIQYVISQGAPDSTKKAQQTIINALIGVALAVVAAGVVSFIGSKLTVPGS